jgi:chromosome partitioning protein
MSKWPKIVSFINHKGGVSKTCSSIHVAYGISIQKTQNRVLVIDLDHQRNLSKFMAIEGTPYKLTIKDVFNDYTLIDKAIQTTKFQNISIIAGSEGIPMIENSIINGDHPWDSLKTIFNTSQRISGNEFDYIIIDTHPGMYPFVKCGLIASTHYVVPLLSECSFSLDGLIQVESWVNTIQKDHNTTLKNLGYIVTQFVKNNRMSEMYLDSIKTARPIDVFNSVIRRNTDIPLAMISGMVVNQHRPSSNGSKDYARLSSEFVGRLSG